MINTYILFNSEIKVFVTIYGESSQFTMERQMKK
jgi:hypothetical protein